MSETKNINSRYYLDQRLVGWGKGYHPIFDVIDRAKELCFLPAVVFSNGTETECREWVERNRDEPTEHALGPYMSRDVIDLIGGVVCGDKPSRIEIIAADGTIITDLTLSIGGDEEHNREQRANAALFVTSFKLLALLEQYHKSFPTKESGKLICEARGWAIQE